jgi:hypothetical protein
VKKNVYNDKVCDPQQLRQFKRVCDKTDALWGLDVAAAEDGRAPKMGTVSLQTCNVAAIFPSSGNWSNRCDKFKPNKQLTKQITKL